MTRKKFLIALILTFCLLLPSCSNKNDNRYFVNNSFYEIEYLNLGEYYYKIYNNEKIYAEAIVTNSEPKIDELSPMVYRLFLSYGTNARTIQYFDLENDRTSQKFSPFSVFTDYWCEENETLKNDGFIAYITKVKGKNDFIIKIQSIYNPEKYSYEIKRDFASDSTVKMIFLNEKELYLDYEVYNNSSSTNEKELKLETVRETVKFR